MIGHFWHPIFGLKWFVFKKFFFILFFIIKLEYETPGTQKVFLSSPLLRGAPSLSSKSLLNVNIQDPLPGQGSALKTHLTVCCQTSSWHSETITPQLSASEGAGRKTRATLMLGSNMQFNASVQMSHPHQTPLWMKVSVLRSAVETKTLTAVEIGEWMSMRQVGEASNKSK